jgi:NADPH:quinone reductase
MLAVRFEAFGDPSVLEVVEVVAPTVDERAALVRVMAASINPSDVKNVAGAMKQTTLVAIGVDARAGCGSEGSSDGIVDHRSSSGCCVGPLVGPSWNP